jgi:hypothetical protein
VGATAGAIAPGSYVWAQQADRAPVLVRLLPLIAEYAAPDTCPGRGGGDDGDAAPAPVFSCWLSRAAASSLEFLTSDADFSEAAASQKVIVLLPGPAARASALPPADSVDVTVTIVPPVYNNARTSQYSPGPGGPEAGAITAGPLSEAEHNKTEAEELQLVSQRLVPVIRAHLAAQVWSQGSSTRARIGGTSLLLTINTLQLRKGATPAQPPFTNAMLVDENTTVTPTVTTHVVTQPANSPTPTPTTHCEQGETEVIAKWVGAAANIMGGVSTELTRAAAAIHSSLTSSPTNHQLHGGGGSSSSATAAGGRGGGGGGGEGDTRRGMQGMIVWGPPGTGKTKFVTTLLEHSPFAWLLCNATELFRSDQGATGFFFLETLFFLVC